MKKLTALFMSILFAFALVACDAKGPDNFFASEGTPKNEEGNITPTEEDNTENVEDSAVSGTDILIVYFSVPEDVNTDGVDAVAGASIVVKDGEKLGNTEYVAKLIQQTVGGDLFRIETVEAYPLDHAR